MNLSQIGMRLLVDDFPKCFDFYTEVLGFEVLWGGRSGPFASFKTKEVDKPCFSMFSSKGMYDYEGYLPLEGSGRTDQVVYVIPTDNAEKDYLELKEKGVEFIGEPREMPQWYMKCVYFRDPEGNLFELCQDWGE